MGYAKAISERPKLILLDILMPDMDGLEVLGKLKCNPATKAIPVAMLTWMDRILDMAHAFEEGALGYIMKPASGKDLHATITRLLKAAAPDAPVELGA